MGKERKDPSGGLNGVVCRAAAKQPLPSQSSTKRDQGTREDREREKCKEGEKESLITTGRTSGKG